MRRGLVLGLSRKTTMKPFRPTVVLAALALALPGLAADRIRMDVQNTFTGPLADTSAMTVLLENDGPDARGVLRVSSEGSEMLYPVELPRGARKKLLTLPTANYGELRFVLQTGGKDVVRTTPASMMGSGQVGSIALIGDDSGGLAFLRTKNASEPQSITSRDVYVTAENAPGRPAAYQPFNAVALGPGAERMGDDTVAALKDYALGGGTVVVLGGASAPILEDRRWAALLPGRNWRPQTLSASPLLAKLGGAALPGAFTVLAPEQLAVGATVRREGATPLETERGLGLGRVVVLGYSPLEPPLSAWAGRSKTIMRFVRAGDTNRARALVASYLNSGQEMGYSSMGGTTVTYTSATAGGPGSGGGYPVPRVATGDPFSTTLPPTGTVFGILAAYFVLVVPVSFLVLRKLKRGELAWVTAPLLSLGFAGLLFRSAENLYSASLSTASQGIVIVQQGSPDAMFYGTSQMFFPRGGSYDLKLKGVDSMSSVRNGDEYGYGYGYRGGSDALAGFNPVDVGEILAPELEANNLAFRELSYTQRLDDADWFAFEKIDKGHLRVQNRSPYAFSGTVANGEFVSKALAMEPGGQAVVELGVGDRAPAGSQLDPRDARNFTRQSGRMALSGNLKGFRPGPQIGKEVADRTGVNVLAFAQEKKG